MVNLSNILNYIQHDKHHIITQNLSIRAVNKSKNSSETKDEREITELGFGMTPQILCEEYLDVYEGFNQK